MYYNPQKVIDVALSQVGYHEKASNADLDNFKANSGDGNWTKFARDMDAPVYHPLSALVGLYVEVVA